MSPRPNPRSANWLLFLLLGIVLGGAASGLGVAFAQNSGGANTVAVDVTVWRYINDPSLLFISTRPEGGRWQTRQQALDMSLVSRSGSFHQSESVRVEVPLPEPPPERCDTSRAPWSSFSSAAREEARARVRLEDGTFIGRYTGVQRTQDGIQVDHIVARSYACEAGGFDWSDEQVRRFLNDQDNLAVVASSENTRKGDKGPADYLPALNRCWYAARWETLAERYAITLPARDQAALDQMLAEPACEGWVDDDLYTPDLTPTPTPTPTATPTATPPAGIVYASCEEAEAAGEERIKGSKGNRWGFPKALVPSARDGDGDGVVCEK